MKAQILKIAGVKSEKEFYKKYPSEEAFMKVHSKEFKKAQLGAKMSIAQVGKKVPYGYNPDYMAEDAYLSEGENAVSYTHLTLPTKRIV